MLEDEHVAGDVPQEIERRTAGVAGSGTTGQSETDPADYDLGDPSYSTGMTEEDEAALDMEVGDPDVPAGTPMPGRGSGAADAATVEVAKTVARNVFRPVRIGLAVYDALKRFAEGDSITVQDPETGEVIGEAV